eukprot:6210754-Pleurochrysis_carterae.AAC.2
MHNGKRTSVGSTSPCYLHPSPASREPLCDTIFEVGKVRCTKRCYPHNFKSSVALVLCVDEPTIT